MLHVTVESKVINKKIAEMIAKCKNTSKAMKLIVDHMKDSVLKNFEEGGRPKWPPLAESTKAKKEEKRGHWDPILVDTNLMRQSIRTLYGPNYSMVRSPGEYNIYHHFGTVNMPKRPFMVIQKEDEIFITGTIIKHIIGGLG